MYKKGDIVFIDCNGYHNYVKVRNGYYNNLHEVMQLTLPYSPSASKEKFIEFYLSPTNSRLCSDLEKLLVGAYDEI